MNSKKKPEKKVQKAISWDQSDQSELNRLSNNAPYCPSRPSFGDHSYVASGIGASKKPKKIQNEENEESNDKKEQ